MSTKRTIKGRMELRPCALAGSEYELIIYGDIGDSWYDTSVTASSVVEQLNALPNTTQQINVRINSYGGSVSDGLAIYNALKRLAARKVVTIDGVAMSIASLIAMAGNEVQMPPTSLLMIHAPWGVASGNANDMREMAQILDTFASAMAAAYAAKTGKPVAEMQALLTDGTDHYYIGEDAVAAGFADTLIADPTTTDANAQAQDDAFAAGLLRFQVPAARLDVVRASARKPAPAPAGHLTAAPASNEDTTMRRLHRAASYRDPHNPDAGGAPSGSAPPATAPGGSGAPPVAPPAAPAAAPPDPHAALRARNERIRSALEPVMEVPGIRDLYVAALSDPSQTFEDVASRALAIQGRGAAPANPAGGSAQAGADQRDKEIEAAVNWIMVRAHQQARRQEDRAGLPPAADGSNPFRGMSLYDIAENRLRASNVDTRRMTRSELVAQAMGLRNVRGAAGHTTSDFPILLENALHKLLLAAYVGANTTWRRWCRKGDVADFRANPRYRIGTFSDLATVNESGNYTQGSLADAEKESITAKRKGRLLVVTREMIVNDDLQAFADISRNLGRVADRTIEKDLFTLLALNSNCGPTMSDGYAMFDSSHHGNIATTSAAPSMASFEAARVLMASQKDPSGNDYLDILPAVWLGPLSIGGTARSINSSVYDPDATSKLQKPNIVQGLFSDIVDTPRLSGTAWFAFANASEEPCFEVAFLNGQDSPTVEMQTDFDSDGIKWKVVHEYGTAGIGWRGGVKNAGA